MCFSIKGQIHQRSTHSFYERKLRAQLFCAYILGLHFTGISLPAQKLRIERWWNWAQDSFMEETSGCQTFLVRGPLKTL